MKGKRKLRKVVAVMLAAVMMLGALAVTPVTVKAEEKKYYHDYANPMNGKPYLADVGTGYMQYKVIKYLNDRGAFGKKRGTEYHFHPEANLIKGRCITWLYNMYGDIVGWGSKNYSSSAKKSWQWAQSNGLIKTGKPTDWATAGWELTVLDRLQNKISGGGMTTNMKSPAVVSNVLGATFIYSFGTLGGDELDPLNYE